MHLVSCSGRNTAYRRRVPAQLTEVYGKKHIVHSLRTDGHRLAEKIEPHITVFLNNFFWELAQPRGRYAGWTREGLQKLVKAEIERIRAERTAQLLRLSVSAETAAPQRHCRSFDEFLSSFFDTARRVKKLRPATLNRHAVSLGVILDALGAASPEQLSREDVIRLDSRLCRTMKPSSVKTYLAAFLSFLNYCLETDAGCVAPEVIAALRALKRAKECASSRTLFSQEELWRIFSAELPRKPVHFFSPVIALTCGLRVSEIAALRADDVRTTESGVVYLTVRRGKTANARRIVPIPQIPVLPAFLDYAKSRKTGVLWNCCPCSISQYFTKYLKRLDIKDESKVFHSLRHNYSSALYAANVSDYYVSALMGHTQKTTAQAYYTHVTPDELYKNGVSLLDFGDALACLPVH